MSEELKTFLDYFTYEREQVSNKETVYYTCSFLKTVGEYVKGDKVHSLSVAMTFYTFDAAGENLSEEYVIN